MRTLGVFGAVVMWCHAVAVGATVSVSGTEMKVFPTEDFGTLSSVQVWDESVGEAVNYSFQGLEFAFGAPEPTQVFSRETPGAVEWGGKLGVEGEWYEFDVGGFADPDTLRFEFGADATPSAWFDESGGTSVGVEQIPNPLIPEPATGALMSVASCGLLMRRRCRLAQ